MKIALYTPLPRFAGDLCDVLRLFWPVETFAVQATAPVAPGDLPKAQYTATPITADMAELRHTFETRNGLWRCTFTFLGQTGAREMAAFPAAGAGNEPADAEKPVAQKSLNADDSARETDALASGASVVDTADSETDGDESVGTVGDSAANTRLVEKRLQKRLCKLALYDLCVALTGHRPPWGSLTGIRPTRLVYENLSQGMSLAQAAEALTRQFDVQPHKAELLRRIVAVQLGLPAPSLNEADVYIGIPFCRTRCAYCSFPGEALGNGRQIAPYLKALFAEMRFTAALMKSRGLTLRALYIGGGTPTALGEDEFAALITETEACFPTPYEFTVEAGRPDTITEAKLRAMLRCGVTRVSVNPQTMNDRTLALIGRDHTAAQAEEAFALARRLGFANINMDVIAGLPGETRADFAHSMARIGELAPDSLTVHTLAIKRSSRLHLEGTPPADPAAVADMVRMGEETAIALGMEPYYLYRQKYMAGQLENVGYARSGAACLYNVDIMEETNAILACGAGAISKRVFADRGLRIERAPNVSNVAVYVERVEDMLHRKEMLF